MREMFGTDWAFGIKNALEKMVSEIFPNLKRNWPLLGAFNFESYLMKEKYLVVILMDKLSGIPCGSSVSKQFPYEDIPALEPGYNSIELWQNYLKRKFRLRFEDAAFIIPIHDSGVNDPGKDFELFSAEEKALWEKQLEYIIERQYDEICKFKGKGDPATIQNIYHISGQNSRVNIGSVDESCNSISTNNSEIFKELRKIIEQISDVEKRSEVLDNVKNMEVAVGTPIFLEKYKNFISSVADHMTIIAPVLPAIVAML